MRRVLMLVVACALLAVGIALAVDEGNDSAKRSAPEARVRVADASVRAEVADDDASRQLGLSGRERLGADEGMLFLLSDDSPSFWMKGMRFPLDIIWIRDGRVVDVSADVPPPPGSGASLPTYSPDRPANRALEVNAGWAADHGISRGDVVRVRRGTASR